MNIRCADMDDVSFTQDAVVLNRGDAVSILLISDQSTYEAIIASIIAAIIPFKNITLYKLDYSLCERKLRRYHHLLDTDHVSSEAAAAIAPPILIVFLNSIMYHVIHKENMTRAYLSNILKNVYTKFQFNIDFAGERRASTSLQYRFHDTDME